MKTKKIVTLETFSKINNFVLRQIESNQPSCFNGMVRVRKYRITVEEIVEDDEVIRERIQKLWDNCANHHHWEPLKVAAKEVGLVLERRRS